MLAACYGYFPPESPAPAPGRRVLFDLTDSGAFLLSPKIGPASSGIEGLLEADSDTAYTVSVLVVHKRSGVEEGWKGERVVVPHACIAGWTERHFSAGRTTLFSAGLAVALAGMRQALGGKGSSSPGSGTTGGVPSK